MPLPRVKLILNGNPREDLVEVNGHDITAAIRGVQVGMAAGEHLAHVTLHLLSTVELDTDIAELMTSPPSGSPGESLAEFLGQIDPGELEQAALGRMNGLEGGPATVGAAVVDVLKEWAKD